MRLLQTILSVLRCSVDFGPLRRSSGFRNGYLNLTIHNVSRLEAYRLKFIVGELSYGIDIPLQRRMHLARIGDLKKKGDSLLNNSNPDIADSFRVEK